MPVVEEYGLLRFGPEVAVSADRDADPPGDPVLAVILDFAKTIFNASLTTIWEQVGRKEKAPTADPIVQHIFVANPDRYFEGDNALPALYLFRNPDDNERRQQQSTDDVRYMDSVLRMLWIMHDAQAKTLRQREGILNALCKRLDASLDRLRDPSWIVATDQAKVAGIKTAFATSTSAVVIANAAMNGDFADDVAGRHVTITAAAVAGAYSTDPIVVIGKSKAGTLREEEVAFSTVNGGETLRTTQRFYGELTQVELPEMLTTEGSIQIGVGPDVVANEWGSNLLDATKLTSIMLRRPAMWTKVQIKMAKGQTSGREESTAAAPQGETRSYHAVAFDIAIRERDMIDIDATYQKLDDASDPNGKGLHAIFNQGNDSFVQDEYM